MSPTATQTSSANVGPGTQPQFREGPVARAIKQQTAQIPSDTFLWASVGCMGLSGVSQLAGRQHASLFFGQWAPSLLILWLYHKLVKVAGSDRVSSHGEGGLR